MGPNIIAALLSGRDYARMVEEQYRWSRLRVMRFKVGPWRFYGNGTPA